jgi:hypothetical protein
MTMLDTFPRKSYGIELLLITIALASIAEINIIGRITGSDLFLIGLFPFLVLRRNALLSRGLLGWVLLLAILWFLSQAVTDLYRETPSDDLARGWAKILVFIINLSSLALLTRLEPRKILIFLVAMAAAGAMKIYLGIGELAVIRDSTVTAWKFGYGYFLNAMTFFVVGMLDRRAKLLGRYLIPPFVVAGVALIMNARNLFGITSIAAVMNFFSRPGYRTSDKSLLIYGMLGGAGVAFALGLYQYSAVSGLLGEDARVKYEAQSQSSIGLLAGRSEFLASTQAIADSPILGHGSWAKDVHYVDIMVERLNKLGIAVEGDAYQSDLIPSHSHLLGAWVEAGLFGAVFWAFVLWQTAVALLSSIRRPDYFVGLVSFILLNMLWDVLFSPFGLDRRVIAAASICLIVAINQLAMRRKADAVVG